MVDSIPLTSFAASSKKRDPSIARKQGMNKSRHNHVIRSLMLSPGKAKSMRPVMMTLPRISAPTTPLHMEYCTMEAHRMSRAGKQKRGLSGVPH
ncbi:MAG: hypothetical protein Q4E72_08345 [bacterium]|nr:hypothetical protein [bacterium]